MRRGSNAAAIAAQTASRATSSRAVGLPFAPGTRSRSSGTHAAPKSLVEIVPARRASSSTSTTSAWRTGPRPFDETNAAATSPALSGVLAKTPECILTPVGMPRTGVRSPTTSMTSRAVPSPPANRTRSTSRRSSGGRRRAGVGRGGDSPVGDRLRERRCLERMPGGDIRAHDAVRGDDAHIRTTQRQPRERAIGSLGGGGNRSELTCPFERDRPIGSPQARRVPRGRRSG